MRISGLSKMIRLDVPARWGWFFVYHADGDEQILFFNQEILKLYGCSTEEEFRVLTGNSFKGMVHPEDLALVENDISAQIKKDHDIDYVEYRIICKDGTEKYVSDCGRFVHTELYGDVYYVFINDITRYKIKKCDQEAASVIMEAYRSENAGSR